MNTTTAATPPFGWLEGRRRRAWDLHQLGWTQCQIAAALGVTQGAVSQWLHRVATAGVAALRAHPAPGRRPQLTVAQLDQLAILLTQGAEAFGFRGAVWTRRRVAALIAQQFGVHYHPRHVGRLLHRMGWTVQKPIVRATQRDEAAIAAWRTKQWPRIKKKPSAKAESSSG